MAAAIETTETESVRISVNQDLCKGCEICVARCPTEVYQMVGAAPDRFPEPTNADACIDCNKCELLCPDFALEVEAIDG